MRTMYYSTISLAFLVLLGTAPLAQAAYAVGDPTIVSCPDGYKGEMTIVETDKAEAPWQILRWNCHGSQGLVKKEVLEKYLIQNPPAKGQARRWEEKCPSGSVGIVLFTEHEGRRFVDSWTCSVDGTRKMTFEELKRLLENKQTLDGLSGVQQQRACPAPYQGTYSMEYRGTKWSLAGWTCVTPGTKNRVSEPTMRMLLPQ